MGNVVRKTTLSLAVALACVGSNWANALSLGEIRVLSHLAEPFRAEISLPIANREELEELRIQLAPEQVFEQAGLDRATLVGTLHFSLQQRPDGSPYIWVQTDDAVKDLGLSFFVEARWRGGSLVRGYDVLLNPSPARVIPRVAAPAKASSPPATEVAIAAPATPPAETPNPEASATPSRKELGPRPSREANRLTKPDDKGIKFGPTLPGDTLSTVARQVDPEMRYTRAQLMAALLQQNPEAFADSDPNRLKAGYTLRIDDMASVPTLAAQAARGTKKTQKSANPTPASVDHSSAANAAAGNDTAAPASEPAAKPAPTKPLAIESTTATGAADSRAALEENVAATRSEIAVTKQAAQTLQKENDTLRARISALEKQVQQVAGAALGPLAPTTANGSTSEALVLAQAPSPVTVAVNPAVVAPPGKIEDFWIIFGAIAAITFLLLGFLGLRPEAREKIAEFWRTKIRREPTDHNVVHVD